MRPIAFLDIETTGLDPLTNEIVEVGIILRDDDPATPERQFHFALHFDEARADEKALEINKYHERADDLAEITISKVAAISLLNVVLKDAMVVGNNVQFDLRFIEQLIQGTPWHYCPLDLKAFVGGRCHMRAPATTKTVEDVSGVRLSKDAHTALVDARWNLRVYDALTTGRPS